MTGAGSHPDGLRTGDIMPDTPPPELRAPQVGDRLGPYRLLELLAVGGMGLVFKAYEGALDRCVAIKVLAPQVAREPGVAQQFLNEARAAAHLRHPNIVHVYTAGQQDGLVYFAMELVVGQSLETLLGQHQRLHPHEAVELVRQAALGLQHAHEQGVIHGDVKPGNLMLAEDGAIKVTDFGLARQFHAARSHTGTGDLFGTPEYVAPEVIEGRAGDQRSDLYSLGATLYRLLTGRPPFTGHSPQQILDQHLHSQPTPIPELNPQVPAAACEIVARLMARQPAARFQNYTELLRALDRHLADRPLVAAPVRPSPALPTPKPNRRGTRLAAIGLAVAVALGAAALLVRYHAKRAAGPPVPTPPPAPAVP